MAQYTYRCTLCLDEMEVTKPLGSAERALPCSSCGGRAVRVFESPGFARSSANTEDQYNPQLGIVHRTDKEADEHIRKLNDLHGTKYTLT